MNALAAWATAFTEGIAAGSDLTAARRAVRIFNAERQKIRSGGAAGLPGGEAKEDVRVKIVNPVTRVGGSLCHRR
jgi:hypothetical protein